MTRRKPHFTWFQILVHIGAWIPLAMLIWAAKTNHLTFNPIQAATQRTGDTAIILLILSLACTPLYTLTRIAVLLKLRRPLGLYGFMYAAIHLFIFTGIDYQFNVQMMIADLAQKRYVLVGLASFLLLLPVAVTSIRWFVVHMKKNWKRLHQAVYLINVLVVIHFAWVVKGDVLRLHGDVVRPLLAGGVVALLLIARIKPIRKRLAVVGQHVARLRPASKPIKSGKPGRVVVNKKIEGMQKEA